MLLKPSSSHRWRRIAGRLVLGAAAVAVSLVIDTHHAFGQLTTTTWQGASGAGWNTAGNWSGGTTTGTTRHFVIDNSLGGGSPVVLNTSPLIGGLTIASGFTLARSAADTAARTLTISGSTASDTIFNNAGTISSGGSSGGVTVFINHLSGTIRNSGTMEATAGTTLTLTAIAPNNAMPIDNTGGTIRTIASGTLSFGARGGVNVTGGSISNDTGTFLPWRSSSYTDVAVTNGGLLEWAAPSASAGSNGWIMTLDGTTSLTNSGTLRVTRDVTGVATTQSSSLTLVSPNASLANSGSMYFATIGSSTSGAGGTVLRFAVTTTATNNGTITIESRSTTGNTSFDVSTNTVTLAGSGTLALSVGDGGMASRAVIQGGAGSQLVNATTHTIRGAGAVGAGFLSTLTNHGTVRADDSGPLTVLLRGGTAGLFTNTATGVVRASGAGGLVFTGSTQFVNEGLVQVDAGSQLALGSAIFSTPGHLKVNGSLTANSAILVTGLLSGTGSVVPAVAISGTLAPGSSIGTLSTGALTLGGGSTFDIELGRQGLSAVSDRTAVAGGVTIDSGANLALTLYTGLSNPFASDMFYLIENDGVDAVSGVFTTLNGVTTTLTEGSQFAWNSQDWLITYQADVGGSSFTGGNDVAIMVVPEPGALALAAIGIAAAAMARRRLHGLIAD